MLPDSKSGQAARPHQIPFTFHVPSLESSLACRRHNNRAGISVLFQEPSHEYWILLSQPNRLARTKLSSKRPCEQRNVSSLNHDLISSNYRYRRRYCQTSCWDTCMEACMYHENSALALAPYLSIVNNCRSIIRLIYVPTYIPPSRLRIDGIKGIFDGKNMIIVMSYFSSDHLFSDKKAWLRLVCTVSSSSSVNLENNASEMKKIEAMIEKLENAIIPNFPWSPSLRRLIARIASTVRYEALGKHSRTPEKKKA